MDIPTRQLQEIESKQEGSRGAFRKTALIGFAVLV